MLQVDRIRFLTATPGAPHVLRVICCAFTLFTSYGTITVHAPSLAPPGSLSTADTPLDDAHRIDQELTGKSWYISGRDAANDETATWFERLVAATA